MLATADRLAAVDPLHAWLGTPGGRFAQWYAQRAVSGRAVRAEAADHDLRVVGREAR